MDRTVHKFAIIEILRRNFDEIKKNKGVRGAYLVICNKNDADNSEVSFIRGNLSKALEAVEDSFFETRFLIQPVSVLKTMKSLRKIA